MKKHLLELENAEEWIRMSKEKIQMKIRMGARKGALKGLIAAVLLSVATILGIFYYFKLPFEYESFFLLENWVIYTIGGLSLVLILIGRAKGIKKTKLKESEKVVNVLLLESNLITLRRLEGFQFLTNPNNVFQPNPKIKTGNSSKLLKKQSAFAS